MRIVRSTFMFMAIVVVAGIGAIYWIERVNLRLSSREADAHAVIDQLRRTLSTIKDAETGQRGYVLTGKTSYLAPYTAAVARFENDLKTLGDMSNAGSLEPKDIARVRELSESKMAELEQTVRLRRDVSFQAAQAVVDNDSGLEVMEKLRETIAIEIQQQNQIVEEMRNEARAAGYCRVGIFLSVGLLNLGFLRWAYRRIRSGIAQIEQTALELGRQKELLSVTLASIGDGVIVTDTQGNVTYLNPEAEKLTGWSVAEAAGHACQKVFNIINETSRNPVESPVHKVLRTGSVVGLANHTLLIRRDGSELPIDDSGAPIRNADQSVRGVVLIFRDFTEHKDAEKKLKDALYLLKAVTDATPDLIFAKDREGRMMLVNSAVLAMIGKTAEQVLGKTEAQWHNVPEQVATIMANDQRIMSSRVSESIEEVVTGANGRAIFLSTKSPLVNEQGEVFGIAGVSRNITDQKRAAEELAAAKEAAEAANIAKDNFLATLSHELRTPLSPVLATLSMWETSNEIPPELLEDVLVMRRNVELEARLIDDLLDLTRIVKGKLPLNLETADIHALIESVASMYQSEIHNKRLRLSLNLAADQHHVCADPARLQQVFWNIFKNATKFTPTGGTIAVASQNDPQGRVKISFQDSGIGMSPETIERLFEPFEQGSDETLRRYGGLGLGMAISRSLMEAQGGEIAASSQGPGKGATFTVSLESTTAPAPEERKPASIAETQPRKSLNILLVEDHEDTARAMSRLLRREGHTVNVAGTVADAVLLANDPFDLLLSDIGLPDGTGVDLIRQIRHTHGDGRMAVALTGFGMEEDIARCRAAGFDDHLTKPVNLQNLDRILQKVSKQE